LGRYPQVQAVSEFSQHANNVQFKLIDFLKNFKFIKSDRPSKYPNLSVAYVRGKDPTLILYDENNEEIENLGIDKWTTDTVDEYLNQILL